MFRRPTLRLQYASNLFGAGWTALRPAPKTPYLAILGNSITAEHPSYLPQLDKALSFFKENWDMTMIIPGPLEYSTYKKNPQIRTSVTDTLRKLVEPYETVALWEQGEWLVQREGVRILGFTGWVPGPTGPTVSEAMRIAPVSIEKDTQNQMCYAEDDREWLQERLRENTDIPTVILSHSLPNAYLVQSGLPGPAYTRLLQDIYSVPMPMRKNVKAWLGGATGSCCSGMFRSIYTAVNAYKAGENSAPNPNFNPSAVFEYDPNSEKPSKMPPMGGVPALLSGAFKRSPAPAFLTQLC